LFFSGTGAILSKLGDVATVFALPEARPPPMSETQYAAPCSCGQVVFDLTKKTPGVRLVCPWCKCAYILGENRGLQAVEAEVVRDLGQSTAFLKERQGKRAVEAKLNKLNIRRRTESQGGAVLETYDPSKGAAFKEVRGKTRLILKKKTVVIKKGAMQPLDAADRPTSKDLQSTISAPLVGKVTGKEAGTQRPLKVPKDCRA